MVAAAIAAGAAVVGVAASIFGASKSAKAAKKAAKAQSIFTYETRMEEIRRAKFDQANTLGYNKAAIGASNIQFGGSAMRNLNSMRDEFSRDIAWRERSASLERTATRSGGQGASIGPQLVKAGAEIAGIIANYNK